MSEGVGVETVCVIVPCHGHLLGLHLISEGGRRGGGGVTRHPQTLGTWETFQLVKSERSAQSVPHVQYRALPTPTWGAEVVGFSRFCVLETQSTRWPHASVLYLGCAQMERRSHSSTSARDPVAE